MKKAFLILLLLLAVSLAVNVWLATREATTETTIERDTMWRDSMIYLPQPAETIPTDRVVYIRIPSPCDSVHNPSAAPEPVEGPGTVGGDSIDVPIPIYQKRYDDSLYTAWVSARRWSHRQRSHALRQAQGPQMGCGPNRRARGCGYRPLCPSGSSQRAGARR